MSQLDSNASSGNEDRRHLGKRSVLLQAEGWKAGIGTGSSAEGRAEGTASRNMVQGPV